MNYSEILAIGISVTGLIVSIVSLEIDRLLIQYPHLREYIYGNKEVNENTPELNQLMSFVELILDITENIELYEQYIPKSRRAGWMKFVNDITSTNAYHFFMKKHASWYEKS